MLSCNLIRRVMVTMLAGLMLPGWLQLLLLTRQRLRGGS
mgnify:CR=1 FL=1